MKQEETPNCLEFGATQLVSYLFYARHLADWFSVKSLKLCHEMSDFKAKMHQIRLPMGRAPVPAGGAYSAPPDPLAGFKGPTSEREEGGDGRGGKGEREGKGGEACPTNKKIVPAPLRHLIKLPGTIK